MSNKEVRGAKANDEEASSDAEAMKIPLGAKATDTTTDEWPSSSAHSFVEGVQTLTILSVPDDTNVVPSGEKHTE